MYRYITYTHTHFFLKQTSASFKSYACIREAIIDTKLDFFKVP